MSGAADFISGFLFLTLDLAADNDANGSQMAGLGFSLS